MDFLVQFWKRWTKVTLVSVHPIHSGSLVCVVGLVHPGVASSIFGAESGCIYSKVRPISGTGIIVLLWIFSCVSKCQ